MGYGDELIAAGEARLLYESDPLRRPVRILDRLGRPRAHPLWAGNPAIAPPERHDTLPAITNGPLARPYCRAKEPTRWHWKPYVCRPAQLFFTPAELDFAASQQPCVVIEPTIKARASPNKDWGFRRWSEFARLAAERGIELTQLGEQAPRLPHVRHWIATPDFRTACAVLGRARAFVGHEGGLHHAAAALGIPAVVIFGGFISPAQTGYASHRNLFTGGRPCGMRVRCRHCSTAMEAITPQHVLHELEAIL